MRRREFTKLALLSIFVPSILGQTQPYYAYGRVIGKVFYGLPKNIIGMKMFQKKLFIYTEDAIYLAQHQSYKKVAHQWRYREIKPV